MLSLYQVAKPMRADPSGTPVSDWKVVGLEEERNRPVVPGAGV